MIALLKLAFVLAGIILLLTRKWNLGLVLLLASIAAGLLFAYPLSGIARDVFQTAVDPLTLRLVLAVVLIMALGELLRQTAGLKGLVEALQALIPDGRIVIAVLPALIGLLPMIGGAMFSAPMVDEVGDRLGAEGARKTFINYWFRHIWEPIFPLFPSVLLATALLGLPTTQLIKATWPIAVAAIAGGLLFGVLGLPRAAPRGLPRAGSRDLPLHAAGDPPQASRTQSLRTLATSIWPIVLVILLSLTLPLDERFSLNVSLVATIALTMVVKRIPMRDLGTIFRKRIPWDTVFVIAGALIFRSVLEGSGAVLAVSDALIRLHVPVPVVAFGVPFIGGLMTGLIAAAFSIGFPVVLPLVVADGGTIAPGWTAWLVAGGLLGAMLSPMHLCLALTRTYFKAEWGPIYRRLAPSALLIAATAAVVLLLA